MCGIIGVISRTESCDVHKDVLKGLFHLQHRGQDAWGTAVQKCTSINVEKHLGLVNTIQTSQSAIDNCSTMCIGHVRYPTNEEYTNMYTQPFVSIDGNIALCHNGNISNYETIAKHEYKLKTTSDSELILQIIHSVLGSSMIINDALIVKAVQKVASVCQGSFSVVCLVKDYGLFAFRDPYGIRPLTLGRRSFNDSTQSDYMFASESIALDMSGYKHFRSVEAGEIICIDEFCRLKSYSYQASVSPMLILQPRPCIFEWIYLSREESVINNVSVYEARLRMGTYLAHKIQRVMDTRCIDYVVPVPDTSKPYAVQVAHVLKKPYREVITKNRYLTRTFIMNNNLVRQKCLNDKFGIVEAAVRGKNILIIDDSIVRGNTLKSIVKKLHRTGVQKIFVASCSPPVKYPNVYGIDIPSFEELLINRKSIPEIEQFLEIDKLIYQDLTDMCTAINDLTRSPMTFELSVFNGQYIDYNKEIEVHHEVLKES